MRSRLVRKLSFRDRANTLVVDRTKRPRVPGRRLSTGNALCDELRLLPPVSSALASLNLLVADRFMSLAVGPLVNTSAVSSSPCAGRVLTGSHSRPKTT